MALERNPWVLLTSHIRARCEDAGISPDYYDPDYLLAVIQEWLGMHDVALTGSGLEPRSQYRVSDDDGWEEEG
jgi:hypothetical protein